ncbi:MAG: sodium-dependent transporter [Muribaculaceae bacterium]|nr:sodium-dependent transporter [Muribaculaceae bacterium]
MSKNQFGSKIGLIAATVGSAVGLGNIWRFPAVTQANGGAAFLLLYIGCVALLGIPVMLAEFSLGRAGQSDAIGAFRRLAPGKAWWIAGALGIFASYIITCFYIVVEGWTLEYLWQSISGNLFNGIDAVKAGGDFSGADAAFLDKMHEYINTPVAPVAFTWLVILINLGVLVGGVQKGIERLSNVLLPLLFMLLVALCCVSLTLPGAGEGVEWFLKPDFSVITPATVINALGQTFFSLSLGMGILITYSAYYPADTRLTPTATIVALMSLLVALLTGFVIFPAVSSFGLTDHSLVGATLVFQTLPEVFACLPAPRLWSAMFFLLLFVAALTSTVSLLEVTIAFCRERFGLSRFKACIATILPLPLLSMVCSLSFSTLADFKILGLTIFDFLDTFATNIILPVVSIAVCVFIGWFAPKGLLGKELSNNGSVRSRFTGTIMFIIRYLAPVMIALILIYTFI